MSASSCVVIGLNLSSDAGCEYHTQRHIVLYSFSLTIDQGHRPPLSVQS